MKTIELADEEYQSIIEQMPYVSDGSYASRIANIIIEAIKRQEKEV